MAGIADNMYKEIAKKANQMKGSRPRKSWDEVFSDSQRFDFEAGQQGIFGLNAQAILAKHGRTNSVADAYDSSSYISSSHSFRDPRKSLQELIEEIAVLELEVAKLEQHLLELYRQAFAERCASTVPYAHERLQSPVSKSTSIVTQQESPRSSRSLWTRAANINILKKHFSHSQAISLPLGSSKSKQNEL